MISGAIKELYLRLSDLDLQNLNISDQTKDYLLKYKINYSYFASTYSQLLQKAIKKINNSVTESVFVDYGGGNGILSLLAKLTGFKVVIYNDLNEKSVDEAKIISKKMDVSIDYYICGDAEAFVDQIDKLNIHPDLICSIDVLEHIYDLEKWISDIAKIPKFCLLFMTGANSKNPFIVHRLKKLQRKSEYHECENNIRFNDTYLNTSILRQREIIIRNKFPELGNGEVEFLSVKSRGLRKDDIEKMVSDYILKGETEYKIDHPTNTCDPYTGNWTEKLIDLERLKAFIESQDLIVEITNSFYSYSNNRTLNIIKFLLNQFIRILGPQSLFLSPTITLEIN